MGDKLTWAHSQLAHSLWVFVTLSWPYSMGKKHYIMCSPGVLMGGLLALGCSQQDLLAMSVGRHGESEKSSEELDRLLAQLVHKVSTLQLSSLIDPCVSLCHGISISVVTSKPHSF